MNKTLTKYNFWTCLLLTVAVVAVYYQVHSFGFINFDDHSYVYENTNIQTGLTLKAIKWAFTATVASNWHPLTWLSHILDWQFYGLNAGGHHITNLIFHIANTLLLFIVLKMMTQAIGPSAFVAALFALHPLHVESVAWIAERKDVLSTFFWFLTMWAYIRFVSRPKITSYLLIVLFFALGLMAKPMLVTLPFVLLLLDYWPLNRFRPAVNPAVNPKDKKVCKSFSLSYLIIEKIPLFAMVLVSCAVTYIVQRKSGAMNIGKNYGFLIRLANALISYLQYIVKMFWPAKLSVFYPHPGQNVSILYAVISAGILLLITVLVFRFAGRHRYLFTGWFWYIGTLVPVIGLVQVGDQAMADRYSYISLTGLFIIISWYSYLKWPHRKDTLRTLAFIVLSVLAVCTYIQLRYWKDSVAICRHAIEADGNNYIAHNSLASALLERGRVDEAIYHDRESVRIRPDSPDAISDLGVALYKAGRVDEAIDCYKRAIQIDPNSEKAHLNYGVALVDKGLLEEAVEYYRSVLKKTDSFYIRSDLGTVLANLGRFDEAILEYRKALSLKPDDKDTLNKCGYSLAKMKKFDEAIALYDKALKISPDFVEARLNLGFALAAVARYEQAAEEYKKILLIQPQNAVAHSDFGVVLFQQGKFDDAITHFSEAIRIDPHYTAAKNNLELVLTEKQKLQNKKPEKIKK